MYVYCNSFALFGNVNFRAYLFFQRWLSPFVALGFICVEARVKKKTMCYFNEIALVIRQTVLN